MVPWIVALKFGVCRTQQHDSQQYFPPSDGHRRDRGSKCRITTITLHCVIDVSAYRTWIHAMNIPLKPVESTVRLSRPIAISCLFTLNIIQEVSVACSQCQPMSRPDNAAIRRTRGLEAVVWTEPDVQDRLILDCFTSGPWKSDCDCRDP